MRRRTLLAAVVAALAAPIAACGSRAERVVIDMRSDGLDPGQVSIARGGAVVWHNRDSVPHTCTCQPADERPAKLPAGASAWDSGWIYTGQLFSHTFDVPGTYVYASRGAEGSALTGTIVVGP